MAFSPQSDKLAIAQSDNMVFVYKIGLEWGEKKSICNKFQHSSSISCLVWPIKRPNELAYGLAEGKVLLLPLTYLLFRSRYINRKIFTFPSCPPARR